jgi:hypothetical protein
VSWRGSVSLPLASTPARPDLLFSESLSSSVVMAKERPSRPNAVEVKDTGRGVPVASLVSSSSSPSSLNTDLLPFRKLDRILKGGCQNLELSRSRSDVVRELKRGRLWWKEGCSEGPAWSEPASEWADEFVSDMAGRKYGSIRVWWMPVSRVRHLIATMCILPRKAVGTISL